MAPDPEPLDPEAVAAAVAAAVARRAPLAATPGLDCYRLVHGWSEGVPGVEIDRYGDAVAIEAKPGVAPPEHALVAAVERALAGGAAGFVATRIVSRDRVRPARVLVGALPAGRTVVNEAGLRYLVDLGRGGNPGLFLDARAARAWIRANAAGRRVLNLFAFSGSLGVAAAAGGARSILHLDSSAGALDWCRANHAENGLPIDDRSVARLNIYQHLRKGAARRQRFDAIVIDPPPGPELPRVGDRTPGGRGPLAILPTLAAMLEPSGWLLAFLHHGAHAPDEAEAEAIAAAAAAGVALRPRWRGTSGDDFPEADPRKKLHLLALERAG